MNLTDFDTPYKPTWCPGCGNFGIWLSLKNALVKLSIPHEKVFIVYGVGCHGNMNDWMNTYGLEGLHGRTLPVAQAVKLANQGLHVIVVSGDGDGLGEGGNHFMHCAKRNPDITVIIHDNGVYGLTTGQASPTAKQGFKTKSTPEGVTDEPVNPLALAMVSGASFVSRGFSGDGVHLTDLMVQAITHKGFSLVDVLQPCVTFNKDYTYAWYRQRVYKLEQDGYTPDNKLKAIEKSLEWGDKIPLGVVYKQDRKTAEELESVTANGPLAEKPLASPNPDALISEFV